MGEEVLDEERALGAERGDEEGEADRAEAVVAKEGHEVAEANEEHQHHADVVVVELSGGVAEV